MNTISLKSFIAAAEEGSFSKAAARLGITQPAVSLSISKLEKELGVKLFERTAGSFSLTGAGGLLLERAREIVEAEERLYAAAANASGDVSGRLTMAASNIPGEYILPRLIRDFTAGYPRVEVNLVISDSAEVAEAVRSGSVEVGFTGARPRGSRMKVTPVCPDFLVLIAPPAHPLASKTVKDPARLLEEGLVLREAGSGTRGLMLESLKQVGINPAGLRVVTELGSTSSVMEAVEEGMGLSMVSIWAAQPRIAAGRIAPVRLKGVEARRDFLMIHRGRDSLSPAAAAFVLHAAANEWPRAQAREVFKAL
jgi:DNA-binding transcriptional LysR family regulator